MKTWKRFEHVDAKTVDEAASILKARNASIIAGGTDILGAMRFEILPDYPECLVNIKSIPGLDYIKEEAGMLRIGALTRLDDIAKSDVIRTGYTALSEAAHRAASPHIRAMGTIGGNICQFTRCWYFRNPDNRFYCLRKGGKKCYGIMGDNRYHSIFGAVKGCMAVNPGDIAPALVVLKAKIKTNKRLIAAQEFWDMVKPGSTILAMDEIVTEIQVPTPARGVKSSFIKFSIRKSIDFPIVNCAAVIGRGDARICLNAVHNRPYRVLKAEELMRGKSVNEKNADAAGAAAVAKARPLPGDRNRWKIQIARTMVKRAILGCA
jgi:xanthine dehydrogenase YagS FAD-binding subunit